MNIVHVVRSLSLETGGPAIALRGLATAQADLGAEVSVLTSYEGSTVSPPRGVTLLCARSPISKWFWTPEFDYHLNRVLPHADVVHLHMTWDYPIAAAARICQRLGKPFLLRPCGQLDNWSMLRGPMKKSAYLRTLGRSLNRASGLHFTSKLEMLNSPQILSVNRRYVIQNGVEAAFLTIPSIKRDFRVSFPELSGQRYILFLGRIHPKKRPETLISSFGDISKAFPNWSLVFGGPGEPEYINYLRKIASNRSVLARTLFTGTLNRKLVLEAMSSADIFCLPSLQENFGNAVAEAMASGVPVVVSEEIDLSREISSKCLGAVIPSGCGQYGDLLSDLMRSQDIRRELGENSRKYALQHFDWSEIAQRTFSAYRDLQGALPVRTNFEEIT